MNSNDLLQDLLTGTLSETDASDSSDEDDQFIKEPPTKITRIENFVEETVPQYSDAVFQEHFRMCRRVVDFIIGYFAQSAYKAASIGGRDKVSNEKAILLSLWYLANTETFRQVADRFNVSRSAHRCLVRVITFLASIKHEYIVWPCKNEAKHIGEEFEKKQGIKNVIGAIDGCHIRINKPKLNQDSYVNRKGYHSILLQGVVNNRKMFIDVYCGEPGSLHDARLLRKSTLYAKAAENEDIFYNVFVGRLGISMS
ncbi:putative nuclease HARBI1 isoform X1 [Photinus pyralis]|uniref:putative nuclease HARBI1 isoform X1 n=1 Tax=Photinus pyralis TaxID=7054 RepID=UPI00126748E7|nr:putative nuclease HARBI1 isoform X1 [Photinus pyralis]